jgi:hypothetical protein
MIIQSHGGQPTPDHARIHRAGEPRLRHPIPALVNAVENANLVVNKQAGTLNRGGSHPGNPILSGLGVRAQLGIGTADRLLGVYLFQDRGQLGNNLISQVAHGPLFATLDFQAGSGQTVAGTPATGAKKNFLRWQTKAGAAEREFWIKSYDYDVVAVKQLPCLDPETLDPVEIEAEIMNPGNPWLDLPIDFMVSWNDEFQVLHRRADGDEEVGFLKAYGGAKFVSFFDTTPGTEGVGVEVNPVTQDVIYNRHKIQVQNTVGLKEITVRFRSKEGSLYFVDVNILVRVVDQEETCVKPSVEGCTALYLKAGTALPAGLPNAPSVPDVQVTEGTEDEPLDQDLLFVTIRSATAGGAPKLRVRKWKYVQSAAALAGAVMVQVGNDEDYLPLSSGSSTPDEDPPYQAPKRLTVAFSVSQLSADLVAFLTVQALDAPSLSEPILIAAARARDISYLPAGSVGGGPVCGY